MSPPKTFPESDSDFEEPWKFHNMSEENYNEQKQSTPIKDNKMNVEAVLFEPSSKPNEKQDLPCKSTPKRKYHKLYSPSSANDFLNEWTASPPSKSRRASLPSPIRKDK